MIKFTDLVKTKQSGCARCFSIIYTLPCQIDKELVKYLTSFGKPVYPLSSVNFIRIDSGAYHIEARLSAKIIKFVMPKKFENSDLSKAARKIEFEKALIEWMSNKLNIMISE